MTLDNFDTLRNRQKNCSKKRAVVAAAHDLHTLESVFHAHKNGLIDPILVGDQEKISAYCLDFGIKPDSLTILDAQNDVQCASLAVDCIRSGQGQLLIKGLIPTGTLLKAVVNREYGIVSAPLLSHVAILEVPSYHKLMFITDGGMVIAPSLEQKRAILKNCLSLCHFLGYDCPKVAILCASETVSANMQETMDADIIKKESSDETYGSCVIEGPISFDLATDLESAKVKGYHSSVAGDADIFLVPSITVGNVLGKSLYGMAGGSMAGIVMGAKVPITVNSRSASPDEKYNSILIAAAMADRL